MKHLILLTLTWTFAFALNTCNIGNEEYGDVLYLYCNVTYFEPININEKNISCELNELNDVLRENVTTIKSYGCDFNEFNKFNLFKNFTSIHLSNAPEPNTIRRETFIELKQLQSIKISYPTTELLAYAFADQPNLRKVQIESDDLKTSELAFRGAYQLKILQIRGLTASSLASGLFHDLNRLEVLLFRSGLTDLGAIDWTGMGNLKSLSVDDCRIANVTGNFIHTLKNLKYLILSANHINFIEFSQVHNLIVLDMTENRIKQLNATSLSGLTNLRTLFLELNIINYIENGAFSNLKKLKKLDLSYNKITELNANTFKGLDNLQYLSLSNLISTINVNTFSALTKLSQINLSEQKELVTIDLNAFPQFIDMQTKTVIDTKISSELDDFEEAELEWFKGTLAFSSTYSAIDATGYIRRRFFEKFWINYQSDQINLHNLEQNIQPRTLVFGNLDLSINRIVLMNFD